MSDAEHAARLGTSVQSEDDADGDGFIAASAGGDDCDDGSADINPDADERCNGTDDDCDTLVDEEDPDVIDANRAYDDLDEDGYGDPKTERRSCDSTPDGVSQGGDCDDTDQAINPDATETCAPGDEDCDELVDEEDPDCVGTFEVWADEDEDGFGEPGTQETVCTSPPKTATNDDDCDDEDKYAFPGAPQVCPGYGDAPYVDCDATSEACVLPSSDGITLYAGTDLGDLVARDGWVAVRRGSDIGIWNAATQSGFPWSWPSSNRRLETDARTPDTLSLAAGDEGFVVGSPGEDSNRGVVYWVYPEGGGITFSELKTAQNSQRIGQAVAFAPGSARSSAQLVSSYRRGGSSRLAYGAPGDGGFRTTLDLDAPPAVVRADRVGSTLAVLTTEPGSNGGAGSLSLFTGPDMPDLSDVATLAGAAGESLGTDAIVCDLDKNASPDVVALTQTAAKAWLDPAGTGDAATWTLSDLDGSPTALAYGDLDGDGATDVAVGVAGGAGAVHVIMGEGRATGAVRLRIEGSAGQGIGSHLAFTDVTNDGIDDLLIAAEASDRILLVPGQADW